MRSLLVLAALFATVLPDASASARNRAEAPRPQAEAAPSRGRKPRATNTSNTAYRNQMKKFSDPFGANGR